METSSQLIPLYSLMLLLNLNLNPIPSLPLLLNQIKALVVLAQ